MVFSSYSFSVVKTTQMVPICINNFLNLLICHLLNNLIRYFFETIISNTHVLIDYITVFFCLKCSLHVEYYYV